VVAVTQLNRDVEASKDKRPGMNHLRGSGSIEQDADIIMLMYRDDYYNENSDQKGVVEVNTAKFREGEVGVDRLANQFNFARVGDLDYRNYTPPAEHKKESQRGFR
jgi:replicative DNA helicase